MCDSNTGQDSFEPNMITLAYVAIAITGVTVICLIGTCCCNSIKGFINEERDLEGLSKAEDIPSTKKGIQKFQANEK